MLAAFCLPFFHLLAVRSISASFEVANGKLVNDGDGISGPDRNWRDYKSASIVEISGVNCFCHHEGLLKASQLRDPTLFDILSLLAQRFSRCRSLTSVSRACGQNEAENSDAGRFRGNGVKNDVCLKMAAKNNVTQWSTNSESRLESLKGSLNLRMCVPHQLPLVSIDDVARRLHPFLCGFYDAWLGPAGTCDLSRTCKGWADEKTPGRRVEGDGDIAEISRLSEEDDDAASPSLSREIPKNIRSSVVKVSFSMAEPLTCVCETPSIEDFMYSNEGNFSIGSESIRYRDDNNGAGRNISISAPSMGRMLDKCDDSQSGKDICIQVDGAFLLPLARLFYPSTLSPPSSLPSSTSTLLNTGVHINAKFIIRICNVLAGASLEDRLFRIDVVCQKYASSGASCREVPCQNVFCHSEEEEEEKQKTGGKSGANADARGAPVRARFLYVATLLFILRY